MNQSAQYAWPFNLNFPRAFSFPAFGTAEWLALAWWDAYKGDASKIPDGDKIKEGVKLNWQCVWGNIAQHHIAPPPGIPNTTDFSMKHPEGWVQTLLDAERFWFAEINFWALQMVVKEYEETNPDGSHFTIYANFTDISDSKEKCEHFCRRFHAYQQARYRWHEHLLEKHCERALGKHAASTPTGYIPQTGAEARASLIGWLSKQRGYANNPLVKEFRRMVRAKKSTLSLNDKKAFCAERTHPSGHRYRTTRATPSRADEMGWLILTWPIWNFHGWKWAHIGEMLMKKFKFVDAKGEPLDFLPTSRKRLQKEVHEKSDAKGSMPVDDWFALVVKFSSNPTPKEKEMHQDWKNKVRSRRGDKAIEKLVRRAIGGELVKQTLPRPKGRGADEKPLLWNFAQQISA